MWIFLIFRDGMMFTLWDRWEVRGNKNFTLNEFVHFFKVKLNHSKNKTVVIPTQCNRPRNTWLQCTHFL